MVIDGQVPPSVEELGRACEARGVAMQMWLVEHSSVFNVDRIRSAECVLFLQRHRSLFAEPIRQLLCEGAKLPRLYRLFGSLEHCLEQAFNVPFSVLRGLNTRVLQTLAAASCIEIRSAAGTELTFSVPPARAWMSNFGASGGNLPATLPPGEVSSYSTDICGRLVADGCVNANFNSKIAFDPRLARSPISLEIENSRVLDWSCEAGPVAALLDHFFSYENTARIGEVGFGTNQGIGGFSGEPCLLNERWPGFHVGLGEHNQPLSRVPWQCALHLDLILASPEIRADGRRVFADGRWIEEALVKGTPCGDLEIGLSDIV